MNLRYIPFLSLILSFSACQTNTNLNKPNVIIILTDDQGWGDISSHGNAQLDTPNMDRLAKDGARFDRFFVSPVCAPTRASLLTGRDHLRTGTQWVTYGLENMNAEEVTFGEVFKKAGYQTGLFGKWHNGSHYPMDPKGQGFDTFFGFKMGHYNNYFDTQLEYNGDMVQTKGFITDVLTDSALAFIERNKERPFLAYVPYNAPHSPFQVPDEYFNKYKKSGLSDKNSAVYGMVENIDFNLGRILAKVDELGIAENTIIIFLTDNGPNGGDRFNGNMKGWKAKVDEGGVRVPLFIKWKDHIEPNTIVEELTAHIDVLPTLAALAGIEDYETKPLDGISFAPLLFDKNANWNDRYFFTHQSRWDSLEQFPASVRNNRYRAVQYGENWELYDMQQDPSQRKNLAVENSEAVEEMSQAYDSWFINVTKDLPNKRLIPVGFDEKPEVQLPATESYFNGNITFFGKSGWSNDWLTNWTSTSDSIWWELDVQDSGSYRIILEYTLEQGNAGSKLEITTDSDEIITTINKVYDPEIVESPDRVVRGEVFEKIWARHSSGIIDLKKGSRRISMKALNIPGKKSIDLKTMILQKVEYTSNE